MVGIKSKGNSHTIFVNAALITLIFISVYQSVGLMYQGFTWLSLLFVPGALCQIICVSDYKQAGRRPGMVSVCLLSLWCALLISHGIRQEVAHDWFYLLVICNYLLVGQQRGNIISGSGLLLLLGLLQAQSNVLDAAAQMLPFVILVVIANLVIRQYQHLIAELEHTQTKDLLTGCANRESFDRELKKASEVCCRYHVKMSIIALHIHDANRQIANMGNVNFDSYLVSFAQVWRSRLRNTDLLSRYSDGLFMVLLPNTARENADFLAGDLLTASNNYEFQQSEQINVFARVAEHDGSESWEDWFKRALNN